MDFFFGLYDRLALHCLGVLVGLIYYALCLAFRGLYLRFGQPLASQISSTDSDAGYQYIDKHLYEWANADPPPLAQTTVYVINKLGYSTSKAERQLGLNGIRGMVFTCRNPQPQT